MSMKSWWDTDDSLSAVFPFEGRRLFGLRAEPVPTQVLIRVPTDASLIKVPLNVIDIELPKLPPPAKE
jgi:hypothetical protein